jgi:hypothetical protein
VTAEGDPTELPNIKNAGSYAFEELGFVRDRRIAKWRWVMRLSVASTP